MSSYGNGTSNCGKNFGANEAYENASRSRLHAANQEYRDKLYAQSMICTTDPCVSPRHHHQSCDEWPSFETASFYDESGLAPGDLIYDTISNLLMLAYDMGEQALCPDPSRRPQLEDVDPIRSESIAARLLNDAWGCYNRELEYTANEVAEQAEEAGQ